MKSWILKCLSFKLLIIISFGLNAQPQFAWKAGLNFQLGTHIQRLGLMYQVFVYGNAFQVSQGVWAHFNFKNLGPKGIYPEMKMFAGFQYSWNPEPGEKYMLSEFSNLTNRINHLGYNFYWYLDKLKMSQTAGALHLNINQVLFVIDNDAFGLNAIDDKFRTGGSYIGFQKDSMMFGLQATLWTGKSHGTVAVADTSYPSRFGYRDIRNTEHAEKSHGILALRADYQWTYRQTARAEVGVDAEQVRHLIQNKLIHDGASRRLMRSKNPHYPMLQEDGSMYLFREDQNVRKPKPYFQLSANQPLFY